MGSGAANSRRPGRLQSHRQSNYFSSSSDGQTRQKYFPINNDTTRKQAAALPRQWTLCQITSFVLMHNHTSHRHHPSCRTITAIIVQQQTSTRIDLPTTESIISRFTRRSHRRSSTLSLHKLVAIGLVFCLLFKLLLAIDNVRRAMSENLFPHYIVDKRCEYLYCSHVESDFYNPEDCFSRSDIQQIILGLVWTISDVLKRTDILYWLDSGTLLGAYREETMIAHDDGADIGISKASYVQLRDNKINFPSEYELQVLGGKFHRPGKRNAAVPGRLTHKGSGLYVDIFVFPDDKTDPSTFGPKPSNCFHSCRPCPALSGGRSEFKVPKDWAYPLQECFFGGRVVSCPAKPERYLDHLYGENFMTPDKKAANTTQAIVKFGD